MLTLYTIPAKAVHTPASSIRINVPLVGMPDVWGNALSLVIPHAPPPVLEVVPTMMRKMAMVAISPVMDKDVELDARSIASAGAPVCVPGTVCRPAGILVKIRALITVAGSVSPSVAVDANLVVRMVAKMNVQVKPMQRVAWVDVRHPVSMVVIRTVLGSAVVLSVVSIAQVPVSSIAESIVWNRPVPPCVPMHALICVRPV